MKFLYVGFLLLAGFLHAAFHGRDLSCGAAFLLSCPANKKGEIFNVPFKSLVMAIMGKQQVT